MLQPDYRVILLSLALVFAPVHAQQPDSSGAALFQAACANCHGAKGTGAPQSHVGFDTPIPDFTDCSFATPETDADWATVVHGGGPVRGFSRLMPAFGVALSDDQILRILGYIRTLCGDARWPRGELNLPRAQLTEKAFPENESVLTMEKAPGSIVSKLIYEKRVGSGAQVELVIPFGAERVADRWTSGVLGDVVLGAKQTVFHSLARGTIVSIAGEVALPTGSTTNGIGKGTYVFEGFLAFGKMLSETAFLQAQSGVELPLDHDRAESEAFARAVIGTTVTQGRYGRAWSPMIEVAGVRELESGAEAEWDIVPQVQFSLNQRQHLLASIGVQLPLTRRDQRSGALVIYFLWDWFDGGLRDGW